MDLIDYIAIVTSLLTIISVCLNVIQRMQRAELIRALRSRSQATYNYFFQIARSADEIRALRGKDETEDKKLENAVSYGCWINGSADAARSDIIAYSREHLNFIPIEEHPAHPILDNLPKPGDEGIKMLRQVPDRRYIPEVEKRENQIEMGGLDVSKNPD